MQFQNAGGRAALQPGVTPITGGSAQDGAILFQSGTGASAVVAQDADLYFNTSGNQLFVGTGYMSTSAHVIPAAGLLGWLGRCEITSPSTTALRLLDSSEAAAPALQFGPAGGATTQVIIPKKVTGIADNSATAVFTVTVPNANHACAIRLDFLSSNGSTDAFESSRCAVGMVILTRVAAGDTAPAVAALTLAQIASVAAGATHTLAYGVSAVAGLSSATQTFTITVTIDDTGNTGANQVVAVATLTNAEATGVTIA